MTRHATDRVDGKIIAECPNKEVPDDEHLATEVEYHHAVDNDLLETFKEAFSTCGKCGEELDFIGQEQPSEVLTDGGQVVCAVCDTEWDTDTREKCRSCGATLDSDGECGFCENLEAVLGGADD